MSDGLWHSADTVVLTGSGHKGDDADLGPRVLPEADIESLISFVDEWRARYGLSPALIEHAIREARDSTLIGETPEQWSPLASATDAALYGRWRSVEQLAAGLAGSDGPEP